jgi:hypothetical protein
MVGGVGGGIRRAVDPLETPLERAHDAVAVDGDQTAFPVVEESGDHEGGEWDGVRSAGQANRKMVANLDISQG